MEPDLAPYFMSGCDRGRAAIVKTYGAQGTGTALGHALVTTPATIAFVNAMIAAILGVIAFMELQMSMTPASVLGVVIFLIAARSRSGSNRYSAAVYQREHARRGPHVGRRPGSHAQVALTDLALCHSECQFV